MNKNPLLLICIDVSKSASASFEFLLLANKRCKFLALRCFKETRRLWKSWLYVVIIISPIWLLDRLCFHFHFQFFSHRGRKTFRFDQPYIRFELLWAKVWSFPWKHKMSICICNTFLKEFHFLILKKAAQKETGGYLMKDKMWAIFVSGTLSLHPLIK